MKIVVTGANGFIGSWVVRRLLEQGHQVVAIVRPEAGIERLQAMPGMFWLEQVDAHATWEWDRLLSGCDAQALIHTAWHTDPADYRTSDKNAESLAFAEMVFERAYANGLKHVVGVGSCLEYGPSEAVHLSSDPLCPQSPYAIAKDCAHEAGRLVASTYKTTFVWARLFHLFGPGEHQNWLVPSALAQWRDGRRFEATTGEQVRDWSHVSDVADALITLASHRVQGPVNVCSGSVRSVRRQLQDVARVAGCADLLALGARATSSQEQMCITGDACRLRGLGWRPRFTAQQAITHTVEAFRQGSWMRGGPTVLRSVPSASMGDLPAVPQVTQARRLAEAV